MLLNFNLKKTYKEDEFVTFRLPEFTQEHVGIPADIPYAMMPKLFRAVTDTLAGETPFSKSEKWYHIARSVLNATSDGVFLRNSIFDPITKSINRNALLPSIQVHDVFREIAKALGYRLTGDYMDDAIEQRALIQEQYGARQIVSRPTMYM